MTILLKMSIFTVHQNSSSQSVVPEPSPSVVPEPSPLGSPGNFTEMQIPRPFPRPTESEPLEDRRWYSVFSPALQVILMPAQV